MGLNIFALVVILVIIAGAIWIVVKLGAVPGKLASARGHPQADAINILGWIGILTMGVGWLIAIVWAYTKPAASTSEIQALGERVARLERQSSGQSYGEIQS